MASRDVLFKRINNALFDMQAATSQTFEQHFLTYARLFTDSSLQPLNEQLTANLDVDQFLEVSSRSQGSMVGSARLAWPESADQVLGLRETGEQPAPVRLRAAQRQVRHRCRPRRGRGRAGRRGGGCSRSGTPR